MKHDKWLERAVSLASQTRSVEAVLNTTRERRDEALHRAHEAGYSVRQIANEVELGSGTVGEIISAQNRKLEAGKSA